MSKSLKKLIDINRLREFKNKLVGTGSAYVQTGAVDQTIAGTKTFSKPIAGSVTGSSGSCTGNAATATKLATARSLWGNKFDGSAAITGAITAPGIELMPPTTTANIGGYLDFHYNQDPADRTSRIIESASGTLSINNVTITTGKVVTAATFIGELKGNVTGNCSGSSGSCTGNAATATKLATAHTVNGTSFDGSANITTANWGTARNITITDGTNTSTAVSVNGSADVALTLPATIKANLTGNCSGSSGSCTGNAATATTATTAKACTGNAATATTAGAVSTSVAADSTKDLVYARMAGSDAFRIRCGGGSDAGYLEIATSDNGNEPIYVRQYDFDGGELGAFNRIVRTLTLLDGSGNTTFPGTVTATTFSGNLNGNAASATKLAAKRTIALSGAATGTATGFDGSGNITIPVTALASSAIRAQWYAAYPDGAEAHNAMWGGRDITAAFNNGTVSTNIANGTFRDIFPGDYITKQVTISGTAYTVNWVIADCDYWWHKGDQSNGMETHHVVIVPQAPIFSANMNDTNTTEGGYAGSRMYRETIPACATGIVNAFGSGHILTFRDLIVNAVNTASISSGAPFWTGASSYWGWYGAQCNLMSEAMVYDGPHYASSALDNIMATRQMSAFRLSERLINYNRQWWWLRDVVSSVVFAHVDGAGQANTTHASHVRGVRPFALLK